MQVDTMTEIGDTLLMRLEPKIFTDTIKCLSDEQKKWVRATGFEKLMYFKEDEYPPSISKKLVSSYNPLSSSMTIKGKTLTITEDSVHEILGLPRGLNPIDFVTDPITKYAWRAQFHDSKRESFKVTGRDIYEAIKATDEVNLNFKMNFMVLMSNMFFKGSKNPYVIQKIVGFTGDLDNCSDYNWCEYFIRCLNKETSAWHEKKDRVFYTGSLAYLIVRYRVITFHVFDRT